jgi:uroporphyrin-III C-methyltransferase
MAQASSSSSGTVYLVGAGPGDPDLLTLRAARLIGEAELIVHDGLVDPAVLALVPTGAELVSVAKSRDRHTLPQEEINALIVREALAGRDVVRLKGGDPFIFGRGGEEMQACRDAGIRVEVVPGISAAIGCAAQAHLPLTHRHASSAVTFVAGQCKGLTDQNWTGLVGADRTLVIYMGLAAAPDIVAKLLADDVAGETPVAVLEKGTRADARALRTRLDDLADMIAREGVVSPALIVVGDVVRHSDARAVQAVFDDMEKQA